MNQKNFKIKKIYFILIYSSLFSSYENAKISTENGDRLYKNKKYYSALSEYNNAINYDSLSDIYYNKRGDTYYNIKEYENALADYNKAIELSNNEKSKQCLYYNNRGNVNYKLKKYDKAREDWELAINISCSNTITKNIEDKITKIKNKIKLKKEEKTSIFYNKEGNDYYKKKDYKNAINSYTQAINLNKENPENKYYYNNRINAYFEIKDHANMVKDLTELITLDKENIFNYYKIGNAYFELKEYENAKKNYITVIKSLELNKKNNILDDEKIEAMEKKIKIIAEIKKEVNDNPLIKPKFVLKNSFS